jgi:hypothetical protein
MYFRIPPTYDYKSEIEIFCLLKEIESPTLYNERIVGEVNMVEIEEDYIDYLINEYPDLYNPFLELLKSFYK